MITLHGESKNSMLFTDGGNAVVIDKVTNMIEETGSLEDLSYIYAWSTPRENPPQVSLELATGALSDISVTTITAAARLYTIPKGAQEEAKRALEWRKEHKRGGTPVGVNTARILAAGGQIGLNKVRHIAKYFPRHEIDKKAEGYKPGEDGFPSRGRIAWALWGGDTAWRWAKQIVERENKAMTADGSSGQMYDTLYSYNGYDSEVDAFDMAEAYGDDRAPEFVARVRLDGSGIDRLYMINQTGKVCVWDGTGWDDLGHVDSDIMTYDRSLDDPYDTVQKHHIFIDPQSAIILSAHFQEASFSTVSVDDLDEEEMNLVAEAAEHIDWVLVDAAMTAAGEEPLSGTDGEYTPDERAQNARRQVRDKTGKFSKAGSRVVVGGDANKRGSITRINPETQSVTVKMDDGSTVDVPANQTEGEDTFKPTGIQNPQQDDQMPLDTSGILAQPRAPIDRPNAVIPGGLPSLKASDLTQIVADYPAWVSSQRSQQQPVPAETKFTPKTPGDNAKPHVKSDYLKDLEKSTGTSLYTDDAKDHPLLQNFFSKKKNNLYYQPITSAAEANTEDKKPESQGLGEEVTPETSDVQPMYFALVSPDDPRAVMDLVCIVPAATNSNSPMTFKRIDQKWEKDPQILADLTSATPPPVVALNGEVFKDTLAQVDGAVTSSAYIFAPQTRNGAIIASLHLAAINPLTAEGGLDRNRGKAEKLRRYWLYGKGAAKIRWNTPGDWTRCYRQLMKYMGPRAKGYCSLRHKEATGVWPGSKFNIGKKNIRASALNEYNIASEDELVAALINRARLADAKARVTLASASTQSFGGSPFTIPLVIPEGVETGDGRTFKKGAITLRELPLPLLWQIKTSDGHDGSVVVGRIDRMERTDDGIGNAHGVFDTGPYGCEAERMVRNGFLRGVSADLDKFEASEESPNDTAETKSDMDDLKDKLKEELEKPEKIGGTKIKVDKARVMAVTIVPKPAFEECKIYIEEDTNSPQQEEEMKPMTDGVYVDQVNDLDAAALVACGMVASSIPVVPPSTWFKNPELTKATPLTVTDDGQVFGHIAAWHVDHIGMSYGTKPPRSRSKYSYFHTGVVRADNGKDYPVGQLTLAGGHASLEASAAQAAKHYDDTGSAIADVTAGEDAHGIWVSGALRSNATPEQIRALRASAPSGDWRPIKGNLELVAVCQVNVPGFPIARARVASGQVYALVAAGAMQLAKMKSDPLAELNNRIAQLEIQTGARPDPTVLAAQAAEAKAKINAVKAERQAALAAKAEALAAKVREGEDYESLGYISMKNRKKLAEEGKALPDGSYPIRNETDLRNAIQAYGRSKPSKRAAVRRHIMKQARMLKKADIIPDEWKTAGLIEDSVVDDIKARVASARAVVNEADTPKAQADKAITAAGGTVIAEESELAEALVAIAEKYGKFNEDDAGVWAGYTPAAQNDKAGMNINCQNCILYAGGTSCKILAMEVEPMGMCRFALIPDGVVKKNG